MQRRTGLDGHPLERLVDGVVRSAALNDAVGNTICFGLGHNVVGVYQVHDRKRG